MTEPLTDQQIENAWRRVIGPRVSRMLEEARRGAFEEAARMADYAADMREAAAIDAQRDSAAGRNWRAMGHREGARSCRELAAEYRRQS